jgi:DNA-3-methyladenine glycosylase I
MPAAIVLRQPAQRARVLERRRCTWATTPLGIAYHDKEWGVPVHDDRVLFEFLILEGAQAGLSWETILQKRENYRKAFASFDPNRISKFNGNKLNALMKDAGIVRNRLKIQSAKTNAIAFLAVQKEFGSFDAYVWRFVGGRPIVLKGSKVPIKTAESDALSKDLLRRGFKFVGSTICYAYMQAVGMADDHAPECFRKR